MRLIEQDVSDKNQIAFSEFAVIAVNCAITVTNNEFVIFVFDKNLCKNEKQVNVLQFLVNVRS